MSLQRNTALFSHLVHMNYKQFFEFFQRRQNQSKDTTSSYFTIFLKVWDQQTSLCLFLHVGTHPLACGSFLLLPCVAGQNFPTLAFCRWVSKSFSSSVTLSPHQPLPRVLHVCGAYMSGFDQESEYGSMPGLHFRLTKTLGKAIILQTSHSPGVSRHCWDHWFPENSLAFWTGFLSASSRPSFLSAFLDILLVNNLLKVHRIIDIHNLFCKSNMNSFGGKNLSQLDIRLLINYLSYLVWLCIQVPLEILMCLIMRCHP